jgi:hypothetical protein
MPKTEDAAAADHCALCDCYSRARMHHCQTRTRAQQLRHVTHTITASLQQQQQQQQYQQQQQQYQQLPVFITTATTAVLLHVILQCAALFSPSMCSKALVQCVAVGNRCGTSRRAQPLSDR